VVSIRRTTNLLFHSYPIPRPPFSCDKWRWALAVQPLTVRFSSLASILDSARFPIRPLSTPTSPCMTKFMGMHRAIPEKLWRFLDPIIAAWQ
jgi:hypothetical protein